MNNKPLFLIFCMVLASFQVMAQNTYNLVVEGFDWGPAVNKVILSKGSTDLSVDPSVYQVYATRSSELSESPINPSGGERTVLSAYPSDAQGNRQEDGNYVTLNLAVAPTIRVSSPFQYMRGHGNVWVDYQLLITNTETLEIWNKESDRIMPLIDEFDLDGKFTHSNVELTYASFTPETDQEKVPLIIWLHGGGEGGTDTTIPLLGNRAANYASPEIQQYFDGAYVLVPQTPTRWMDSGDGSTSGQVDDIYFKALKALFDDFVAKNPNVDIDRIYVGGCSNGGYMSLKLILEYPDYFAGGYISALAYRAAYLSDDQAKSIKNVPIWFVHSKDDSTTVADQTVLPVYDKLIKAGAKDVHLTFYEHVVDITGLLGGEDYHYPGHWSWIYSHANLSQTDFDGSPVKVNGVPVTIMQWLSSQSN
ncbi:prolyl oligopeptidase family serine peptidase [Algoriphagus lutimaris]|uniref:prolyl oligopeptidase family serine peptidase n=1 Tax=Algoriphagus lutimaris TaxID=613197 RepID=UPI00196AE721|nr:prolyl oligopeptidase family serine peptidase [Algoriphagus lutimaris]MBN3520413.1 prolyl oligopeptidase family serine peptidase [Algoriphagus lutimaris]